jgi:hypothetical protein
MAAVLIGILSLIVLGIPMALAIDRRARGALLLGTSFLYGSGCISLVLLALSVVHIRWSLISVAVPTLIAWSALWFVRTPATGDRRPATPHWMDLFTLWTLVGYFFYATLAPVWEWDFWAIWGLKARVFFEQAGIDWRFLESPWNVFAHPDYPLLLPLNYDFIALLQGSWSDRWLGVLIGAYVVAVVLIVRDLAAQEVPPLYAALIGTVATTLAASHFIGLAEAPLIAFGASAVLFIRRALLFDDAPAWRHGALLLGCAMNVKNEGIALAVSVAFALLIIRPRALGRLWPAGAIAGPWLLLRATHALPTDIVAGSAISRMLLRAHHALPMLGYLVDQLAEPWFWIAVLAALIVAPAAGRKREAFVLIASGTQLAFYVASYFATPHDPRWHIDNSWSRLTFHFALPLTYSALVMLAVWFPGGQESSPDAEARPVE